jgi:hypothetical protein
MQTYDLDGIDSMFYCVTLCLSINYCTVQAGAVTYVLHCMYTHGTSTTRTRLPPPEKPKIEQNRISEMLLENCQESR